MNGKNETMRKPRNPETLSKRDREVANALHARIRYWDGLADYAESELRFDDASAIRLISAKLSAELAEIIWEN